MTALLADPIGLILVDLRQDGEIEGRGRRRGGPFERASVPRIAKRVTQALAVETQQQPEVTNLQTYVGTASPYNFNGLVRHYYLRRGSNVEDLVWGLFMAKYIFQGADASLPVAPMLNHIERSGFEIHSVENVTERAVDLPRPQLVVVHDFGVTPGDVSLDSAIEARMTAGSTAIRLVSRRWVTIA